MGRKLKVFVVPAGFSDAYVAAPSRKAALAAWGSEHDLFARGVAQEVTDAALMAEPLAKPGEVVKRSRGTTAEQIAALPAQPVRPAKAEAVEETPAPRAKTTRSATKRATSAPRKAEPKPESAPKPPPKPSSDALAAAEQALAEIEDSYRDADAKLVVRQRVLDRERRDLDAKHDRDRKARSEAVAVERDRYDTAMTRWRKRRGA
ncbi:hypothetical protein U1872_05755 [Sphingomonas sp. RB3P16]|uniref:hypothetical protein n=1 Tax=Parasphingomonas frigoris TaxID=3096163 RepID=UPI002FC7F85F